MEDEGFPNLRGKAMEPVTVEAFRVTTGAERMALRGEGRGDAAEGEYGAGGVDLGKVPGVSDGARGARRRHG